MKTGWNTLRVKVTALLVGAILLVVSLASPISFFLATLNHAPPFESREAEQLTILIRLVERLPRSEDLLPYLRSTEPQGRIVEMPSQRLTAALARAGFSNRVSVIDTGEDHSEIVSIQLSSGGYLVIPHGRPPSPPNLILELIAWVAMIALGTTAAVTFAVGRLTRPLTLIEQALDSVSGTGDLPHLEERGTTEVRAAARTINRLSDQLRAALETRMRIVAAAAHDLRTPMTRMRLRAEFIEDEEDRGKWLHDIEEVDRIADSAIRLVREEVRPDMKVDLALDQLAREVVDDLVSMSLPAQMGRVAPVRVQGHALALKRAVRNLAINAATHGLEATLAVYLETNAAVLEITDRGPGIPETLLPRVFEPFFRIDPARQPSGPAAGAGLGLAIAKEIVERQGGRLSISNGPNGGLVQTLRLPLADPSPKRLSAPEWPGSH